MTSVRVARHSGFIETEADILAGVKALRRKCPAMRHAHDLAGDPPLRRRAAGFEGLARIIVAQQLSTASAAAIWKRVAERVRPLGEQLRGVTSFAGATILGDGYVALILDVVDLARRAGVLSDLAGYRHGGFVGQGAEGLPDGFGDFLAGEHRLEVAGPIADHEEGDLPAGAGGDDPASDGDRLADVVSELVDVGVCHRWRIVAPERRAVNAG